MREIKDFHQAQIVINELLDWKSRLENKDWDFHQLKIKNAGDGVDPRDYVTLRQLPTMPDIPNAPDQFYTLYWTRDSVIAGQVVPSATIGRGREGIPVEAIISCETAPSGGPFSVNFKVGGVTLLVNDISIPNAQKGPIFSSSFITPVPKLARHIKVQPVITVNNGAGIVTIELVVKRSDA